MPFSKKTLFFYFFLIPSIFYAGLITHFSYDFFAYDHLWKAYNALATSILNGRLDVPYEAIGRESLYYNDKVYFYYGYFPVILRLIVSPLIDLNTVTLARVSVWLMATIGAAVLQYALIFYSRPKNSPQQWNLLSRIKLILLSLIVWFGSAYFIIIQKGMIYHEPYAASLMLGSLFIVLVYKDIFWDFESRKYRLALYAIIAALAVHTRQTVAVSLYLAVILLIFMSVLDTVKKDGIDKITFYTYLVEGIKKSYMPLLILFLGGALLLFMNYLRFDDFLSMGKGQYGYTRAGETISPRACATYITGAGRFEIGRIIPNLIYYIKGGSYIHGRLIDYLGLGYVRLEYYKIQFIWLWSSIFIIFLLVSGRIVKELYVNRNSQTVLVNGLMGAFLISALLLLSYTTITVRYVADLWLPLGFALLLFSKQWMADNISEHKYLWYIIPVSIILNIAYSTYVYTEYKKWDISTTKDGTVSEEILNKLYNPPPRLSKKEKKEACKKYNFNTNK